MSGSINRVALLGNLGADPELRRTKAGDPVATFRMAMTDTWTDKVSGEKREHTEWATIVCFNEGICGVIEKYLKKGSKAYVEGRFQTREWEDKDGNKRWSTEVVINRFGGQLVLLGDPSGRGARSEDEYGQTRTREAAAAPAGPSYADVKGNAREPIYTSQGAMQPGEFTRGAPVGGGYSDDEIPFSPEWR